MEPIQNPNKFITLVEEKLGVRMINEDKVTRTIYGLVTSKGLVNGLGEDAEPERILAKYDSYHGYMTKGGYKVKHGTFFDVIAYRKTGELKVIENPKIVLLIKVNGELVAQEEGAPESLEVKIAKKQIEKKTEYNIELDRQRKYLTEDLALAKSSFERDSVLYHKSSYSISTTEFEKSRQGYIQKLYSYSVFNASLKNNESDFLRMKETRLDLQVQYEKEERQFILTMEESLQLLRSSISQWEERYVIKSPVAGRVTLTRFRNENQVIKAGETLATVIPDSTTNIVARVVIPISGFGRIEIGQTVNIKLSGFPYMQYGVLKGRIYSMSQVPGEGGFSADIELTGGMTSTYREKIRFIHEMDGTADIITGDSRLIFRFIKPLKALVNK